MPTKQIEATEPLPLSQVIEYMTAVGDNTTIKNIQPLYEARLYKGDERFEPAFDLAASVKDYEAAVASV